MTNTKLTFREFQNHDQDGVYTLILSILESEFKDIPPEGFLNDVKDVQSSYDGDGNHFFICESGGEVVGTIAVKRDDDTTALMRRFFVNPHYRGKKIGKRLMEMVFDYCRDNKYDKIIFTGNNRMHKVHAVLKKAGFIEEEDIMLLNLELFKLSYTL
jgi:GNAT superfamily N-acetyltransferase